MEQVLTKHEPVANEATERNAIRTEFNSAPPESYFPESVVAIVTGVSRAKLALDRMKRIGLPFYRINSAVRYKAGDVRSWLEKNRVEVK